MIKGCIHILIGVIWLWYTFRNQAENQSIIASNWRGITIGAILIFMGVFYIIKS
jgi:hypothetical protein